ncbi:MAG: hypothetical protein KDD55_06035 [Bdellovibrionales bacterium]|nr:hypothetical protein [Bdellovibrionales bacterium]
MKRTLIFLLLLVVFSPSAFAKEPAKQLTGWEAFAELTRGNMRFVQGLNSQYARDFEKRVELLKQSKPHTLVVTCSDSRVVPEMIFDQGLGSLYVLRTPGLVLDDTVLGGVEYGVEELGVGLVVVLGSTSCATKYWRAKGTRSRALEKLSLTLDAQYSGDSMELGAGQGHQNMLKDTEESRIAEWLFTNSTVLQREAQRRLLLIAQGTYDLRSGRVEFARVGQPSIVDKRIKWRKSVRDGFSSKTDVSENPAR